MREPANPARGAARQAAGAEVRPGAARAPNEHEREGASWLGWFGRPRNLVFAVLALVLALGGGAKLLQWLRARLARRRLADPRITDEEILASAAHGRAAIDELFELLAPRQPARIRNAAARALARLWAEDQLVAEEEQTLVRAAHDISTRARRVYPRQIDQEIPIEAHLDLWFLGSPDEPGSLKPHQLELAWRVPGARRVSLESYSPWQPANAPFLFWIEPRDFEGPGPHRLSIQARVRTASLTSEWDMELPPHTLSLEFDERLAVEAIFASPDAERGRVIEDAVRLEARGSGFQAPKDSEPRAFAVTREFALNETPELVVDPLDLDIAHEIALEFEGFAGRVSCRAVVVPRGEPAGKGGARSRVLEIIESDEEPALELAGVHRMRAVLTPSARAGWLHSDVRSVWPGTITTEWTPVRVVRR